FRPGDATNPHIRKVGEVEEVKEYKVKIVYTREGIIKKAIEALKKVYPYKEPTYKVTRLK
ncbi:hypothetical protein P154DRAFT_444983, partial [Amniculicola lignicola CBS 123094]